MSMADLRTAGLRRSPIAVGALVGLIAAVPTGIVIQLGTDLLPILGGITGSESLVAGWILHLLLSTAFGALFGWHVKWPVFRTLTDTVAGTVLFGVVYGVVWYAYVMIGIVLPGIVELLEVSGEGIPLFNVPGPSGAALLAAGAFAIAYFLYGIILGGGFAILEDVRAEPEPRGPDAD